MGPYQFRRLEIARLRTQAPIATESHRENISGHAPAARCPHRKAPFQNPLSNDIGRMHGRSTKLNVLIEIHAERFGAARDILTIDRRRKT